MLPQRSVGSSHAAHRHPSHTCLAAYFDPSQAYLSHNAYHAYHNPPDRRPIVPNMPHPNNTSVRKSKGLKFPGIDNIVGAYTNTKTGVAIQISEEVSTAPYACTSTSIHFSHPLCFSIHVTALRICHSAPIASQSGRVTLDNPGHEKEYSVEWFLNGGPPDRHLHNEG